MNATSLHATETGVRVQQVPDGLYGSVPLDGFIDVALVEDDKTALQDMFQRRTLFAPIAGHDVNLGFVRTSAWMRFALTLSPQVEQPQDLLLSIMPNFTDELDAYVGVLKTGMSATDFHRYEMGDHSPRSHANLNTSANILPLELHPGQTTIIYIRAHNQDASLNVSAEVLSPAYYEYRSILQNLVRGLWFGGMGVLLIIQFFFLYFDRKKFYIFLMLDIVAVSSTYFGSLGLARLLFFNEGGLGNDYLTSMSSWFGLAAGALSIAAILELPQRHPRINLYFRFAATVGILGVICVLLGVNRYFVLMAGPVILVLTTLAMAVALSDFRRRPNAQTGLNFAAFGLLWAGLIATNGQRYGIFPWPSWVAGSYAATSIMHFTLLTGSLAVRLRNAETAARNADRRALQAANAAEQQANDLVLERTRELVEAKRVAENALCAELQAQEQQVRFMEVISHQYRTPLGVIRTNLQSIRLTLPNNDEPNRERLDRAHVGIARLVEVLEVNLTRSKLQGPAFQPSFSEIGVVDIVNQAITSARDLLHGITLDVSITADAEHAIIRADAEMLRLAIINLLENAFKFSAPVGSTLVWLDVFREMDEVHIQIRDKGIGIGAEPVEELIRNHMRGANSAHIEGTGVGLSLVKRTTDAHGGRFSLLSGIDGGTEAKIVLPSLV
ncbi:sensor histidine kinase [Agrobacterium rosae]|nr:sensor histidine kinase [Agrobacterium rosae]MCM2431454.1 sensor histidine kinase [Agrobacterium rosae]MDX8328880.1 sensor histidine kinase [Agrobacterium rosae]